MSSSSSSACPAAAAQTAIREGDYEKLPNLVHSGTQALLWQPNASGWTALHYAASQVCPVERWEWLLRQASQAGDSTHNQDSSQDSSETTVNTTVNLSNFYSRRNHVGETVMDVFLQTAIHPPSWQSFQVKQAAILLQQAIDQICTDTVLQAETHRLLASDQSLSIARPSTTKNYLAVTRCVRFLRHLTLLCEAAMYGTVGEQYGATDNGAWMTAVARTGACPTRIARLWVTLYPQQIQLPSSLCQYHHHRYLLHIWAAASLSSGEISAHPDDDGLVTTLSQEQPVWPTIRDQKGRCPLHVAVAVGRSWKALEPLLEVAPRVLHQEDPVTRLPIVALAAMAPLPTCQTLQMRARQTVAGPHGLHTIFDLLSAPRREVALRKAAVAHDCQVLTTLYHLLRRYPSALSAKTYQNERGTILSVKTTSSAARG
jgi:hypothetical protein